MITNRDYSASRLPKHEVSHSPKAVSLGLQLSSGEQFAHQRQNDEQRQFANSSRTVLKRAFRVQRGSQRGHVNVYDANLCARVAVQKKLADLATFASGVVVGLATCNRLVSAGSAIGKKRYNFKSLRHCLHASDERSGGRVHVRGSLFVKSHIRTIGPICQGV